MTLREIAFAQLMLRDAGQLVRVDGRAGPKTTEATQKYQRAGGLTADGVIGPMTESALLADSIISNAPLAEDPFPGWRGSLAFLVQWEGHNGGVYVPPGRHSGVTLDPGFDLRFHDPHELAKIYAGILTPAELTLLSEACRKHNNLATYFVERENIRAIKIGRLEAAAVLPVIAADYWRLVRSSVPLKALGRAHAAVHTALLSLCYNAGADDVEPLARLVEQSDWLGLAEAIGTIPKIIDRRQAEARLILDALARELPPPTGSLELE